MLRVCTSSIKYLQVDPPKNYCEGLYLEERSILTGAPRSSYSYPGRTLAIYQISTCDMALGIRHKTFCLLNVPPYLRAAARPS